MKVFGLVMVMLVMGSCFAKAARRSVVVKNVDAKQKKAMGTNNNNGVVVVNDDDDDDDNESSSVDGENHHAYSIPDFNRQGGTTPSRD